MKAMPIILKHIRKEPATGARSGQLLGPRLRSDVLCAQNTDLQKEGEPMVH